MNSARSWVVFAAAVLVYLVGVTQRTTLGIAGVEATTRFDVTAAAVSTLAVVQIVIYAAMQIPVGVMADRFGSRPLIIAGAVLMGCGQVVLAFAPTFGFALLARSLVGLGDAFTFVSVIRLLPTWFSGRILPQLAQWVGVAGALGQVVSAFPFAIALHTLGWRPAFLLASSFSLLALVVALCLVRAGTPPALTGPIPTGGVIVQLRAARRRPGTQLGFWVHMAAASPGNALVFLWGYPFLTAALHYPLPLASSLMSLFVVGTLVAGPIIGVSIARFPLRRSSLVLGVVSVIFLCWALVLAWPGYPPVGLVAVLFLLMGAGGPGSLVGFDVARTFNPTHALGSASGIVNSGGFIGGFVSMLAIGIVLDRVDAVRVAAGHASQLYSFDSFRIAFLVPFVVAAIAVTGLLVARRRTRRLMFIEQGISVAPLWVALFSRWRRSSP